MEVRWSDDVYFKSATTDRSISAGRGYSNNDLVDNTGDKEIVKATPEGGQHQLLPYDYQLSIIFVQTTPVL